MNSSLWFIVPAAGRLQLARICLRQLRRTCDALIENGIEATAVVVADDENLETARELRFGTVERDNQFVSRKFNDGFQLACDPAFNPRPADYAIAMGSDDWIDWRIIRPEILPEPDEIVGFQFCSFVSGDGSQLAKTFLRNTGGCGLRIYPRQVLEQVGFRPGDEDRRRGCDTSILTNVREAVAAVKVMHVATDPRSIVDWKTSGEQLNEYEQVLARHGRSADITDPFTDLQGFYPAEALEEMEAHYGLVLA